MLSKETLIKVAILAREGSPGERAAATKILEKAGVTANEVLADPADKTILVSFTYKSRDERTIILQNYFRLTHSNHANYYKMGSRNAEIEIPRSLADEFVETNKTLISLWRKQVKTFLTAFITRQRLFSDRDDGEECSLSAQEIEEIMNMARGIKHANLGRLLNE